MPIVVTLKLEIVSCKFVVLPDNVPVRVPLGLRLKLIINSPLVSTLLSFAKTSTVAEKTSVTKFGYLEIT